MEYSAIASGHFSASDADADGFLDSLEWLRYLNRNKSKGAPKNDEDDVDNQR